MHLPLGLYPKLLLLFSRLVQSYLCHPMDCSMSGFPVHHRLLEPTQTHVHCIGDDAIQPSLPLSSPSPPAFNLSQHQGLFQWVGSLHQAAKVLELRFSVSPSNEYSGLISFRKDWLDLLMVQGTLKNLLQHHISKASSCYYSILHNKESKMEVFKWKKIQSLYSHHC